MIRRRNTPSSPTRLAAALLLLWAARAAAQAPGQFDLGGGDPPTITGALNGSVLVSNPSPLVLQVNVDFGELSPLNANGLVVVRVPVVIRSDSPYQVTASVASSSIGTDPNGLQFTDIGFGVVNVRRLAKGVACRTPHTVYPPFNTDPSQAASASGGRVSFPATLATLGASTVVMNGPLLSTKLNLRPPILPPALADNGWSFDAVLAVAPQFFVPGTAAVTLRFSINPGPNLSCQ